jgi:hypothetical protein
VNICKCIVLIVVCSIGIACVGYTQTITKYSVVGKAFDAVSSQGYKLDVTDDGTGVLRGENISIVENGRKIIGEVAGRIDYAKHKMYIKEIRVKNLRPGETQNDYCFFDITADYYIKDGRTYITGKYIGRTPNGKECSRGQVVLMAPKSVEAIHTDYVKKVAEAKKITLPKKITPPVKKVVVKKVDTPIAVATIVEPPAKKEKKIFPSVGKGVSMYEYDTDNLVLTITDYDKDDGDIIALRINDNVLKDKYILTPKSDTILLDMKLLGNGTGNDTISIYAYNEGYYSPNSAKLMIYDAKQEYLFYACNNYQERKYLILRKREE